MSASSETSVGKFAIGERVLCFHGPLIYEAKCLKTELCDNELKYYIHYAGWNKNWDEWVPESRVLKYNDQNLQKQKDLQKQHKVAPQKLKKIPTPKSRKSSITSETGKENAEGSEREASKTTPMRERRFSASDYAQIVKPKLTVSELEKKIIIPDNLQSWLKKDKNMVCQQKKLTKLPAPVSIEKILDQYVEYVASLNKPDRQEAVICIVNGIRDYFFTTMPNQLLYAVEKEQYNNLVRDHPDASTTSLYGAVHLLRLLVKIPTLMSHTKIIEKGTKIMWQHLTELLRYLQDNCEKFFAKENYEGVPPSTDRKSLKTEVLSPDKRVKKEVNYRSGGRNMTEKGARTQVKTEDEKASHKELKRKREISSDDINSSDNNTSSGEEPVSKKIKLGKTARETLDRNSGNYSDSSEDKHSRQKDMKNKFEKGRIRKSDRNRDSSSSDATSK